MNRYTVDVTWPTSTVAQIHAERYPELEVTILDPATTSDVTGLRVTGPLLILAYWVLLEHCGGDLTAACAVIGTATSTNTCCNRCGDAEMIRETVELCEDCGYAVTAIQAAEIQAAKTATVADPHRINLS